MRRYVLTGLLAVILLSSSLAPVLAQSTPQPIESEAPFYDDENGSTNMSGWVPGDGNATADAVLEFLARTPGIWIGSGDVDPSGSGYEGVLLTALIIGGAALLAMVGTGVGPIAGSMIGMVLAFGMTTIGIIPLWIQPLLLFALVGVPASKALIQVFRG